MAVRSKVRPHTIKVGGDKYFVGKKATRAVTKTATSKAVTLTKKAGGSISRTVAASGTTHGFRIGKYAKAHATTNADGSTTYATKSGGTKTVTMAVAGEPKKKKAKKTTGSSGQGTNTSSGGSSSGD